jgi:hypothetical protein
MSTVTPKLAAKSDSATCCSTRSDLMHPGPTQPGVVQAGLAQMSSPSTPAWRPNRVQAGLLHPGLAQPGPVQSVSTQPGSKSDAAKLDSTASRRQSSFSTVPAMAAPGAAVAVLGLAAAFGLVLVTGCKKEPAAVAAPSAAGEAKPVVDLGEIPPPAGGDISGEIQVAPAVADKVKAGDTIFIIARNAATGTAVAVARVIAPDKFPVPFTLTGSHNMQGGSGLFGKVKLQARVDKDGDAMTKNPGDVIGEVPNLVQVPATGVVLTLDRLM